MRITVRKHSWQGHFRYSWECVVVERTAGQILLAAEWRGPGEPRVGEISFLPGDRFLEYYYPGRAYAIWQVNQPDGALKGWYCNISTPLTEGPETLIFDDLLLDVLVYPDGRYVVLDRDEFEAACAEGLSADHVALAESALLELIGLIHSGTAPFSFAPASARAIERV